MSSSPPPSRLFDTHAHLDDEQLVDQVDAVVRRAADASVDSILTVGTTVTSSRACVELAHRFDGVHAAVGIQPNYVKEAKPAAWDQIVELARDDQVVALGETGLDAYWDYAPFELQQEMFRRHVLLSVATGLPFIVHMRDCAGAVVSLLQDVARGQSLRGVMHSFTGDEAVAEACLDLGLYISFAGMVTFKSAAALRNVAKVIPDDRLLLETDAPYLAPHPHRGRRPNEPALLIHTAQCVAEVRGVAVHELAAQTTANARRLFSGA